MCRISVQPAGLIFPVASLESTGVKHTSCTFEHATKFTKIKGAPGNQSAVPYKVMSFDIEASSAHGAFPLAKKDYLLLATELANRPQERSVASMITSAFGSGDLSVSKVFCKRPPSQAELAGLVKAFTTKAMRVEGPDGTVQKLADEVRAEKRKNSEAVVTAFRLHFERLNFPGVRGDEVTFIGSSFYRIQGNNAPYLNDVLVVGSCSDEKEVPNSRIRSCSTEKTNAVGMESASSRGRS